MRARYGKNDIMLNDHVRAVEIVLTETRLAALAESQGNSAESSQYYAQAVADCPKAWNDGCTTERLRQIAQRLDRKLPAPTHIPRIDLKDGRRRTSKSGLLLSLSHRGTESAIPGQFGLLPPGMLCNVTTYGAPLPSANVRGSIIRQARSL